MNLVDLAEDNIRRFGEHIRLVYEDREYSNVQLNEDSQRLAHALAEAGVRPGDRVACIALNSPETSITYSAVWRMGAVLVPILFLLSPTEVGFILRDAEPRVVVVDALLYPSFRGAIEGSPSVRRVILAGADSAPGSTVAFGQALAGRPALFPRADVGEDEMAVLLYTSGTTGQPKGVMLSHNNLYANARAAAETQHYTREDVALFMLPLAHSYGLTLMNVGQLYGMKGVLLRWFDAGESLRLIEEHRVTNLAGVPTMFQLILSHPDAGTRDTSSLKRCTSGAAPLPVELLRRFQDKFGCTILEGYGLSEAAPVVTGHREGRPQKPGSIGVPLPGVEVRIVDDQGCDLPAGEVGELLVRGPNVMLGYYRMPIETAETLRGGWLYTGDMARMDPDGYLYIVERKKDLIIRGGFNVFPRDVEEVIQSHPAVAEAAVIGIPDPVLGEELKAYVVLTCDQGATADDIHEHCRSRLARFKCPREVVFITSLPKNAIGKVLRKELRRMHAEQVETA
ncbi:MAG: long-chain-fatty-acid--CoA ligase [bacterium]|nr:long-chain-fatty-acid--CoA ligase [bacterium]